MKGNGWMVGVVMMLAGFAAPSQAAVSAGNILAAPATVDNIFRQELRVQMAATDARAGTAKPAVEAGAQPQAPQTAAGAGSAHGGDGRQRSLALGRDLADRQDVHRIRHAADGCLGRAHVHGVIRPLRVDLKPIPAAGIVR
jgi:hypothetical protein